MREWVWVLGRCAATAIVGGVIWLAGAGAARAATWDASAIGSHPMLYLDSPPAFKEAMFREAAASGATSIRVDVFIPFIVLGSLGERSWSELDDLGRLARRYRLQVVGLLYGTPWWLAKCSAGVPSAESYRCPPRSAEAYARLVGEIARRERGVIDVWQVLNEPNNRFVFSGDVRDYARVLIAVSREIRRANPAARIVLGGLGGPQMQTWPARLLAIPGTRGAFDIASVHLRGRLRVVVGAVAFWRRRLDSLGFRGPIWVTEHGYPADPAYQWDERFQGELGQARYLSRSLPALIGAGVDRIFVTLRDNRGGTWASEGLIGGVNDPPSGDPQVRRKPADAAVRKFAMTLLMRAPPLRGLAPPPLFAQALAGQLRADRRCYAPGGVMALTGTGFVPGRQVQLRFLLASRRRGALRLSARAPVTAAPAGTFAAKYRAPALATRTDRRETLTVEADPITGSAAPHPPPQPPQARNGPRSA